MIETLNKRIRQVAKRLADELIDKNPEDYFICKSDYGCYNNGVGYTIYGQEVEYDKDKAFKDALEVIANNMDYGGDDYEIINDEVRTKLVDYIKNLEE